MGCKPSVRGTAVSSFLGPVPVGFVSDFVVSESVVATGAVFSFVPDLFSDFETGSAAECFVVDGPDVSFFVLPMRRFVSDFDITILVSVVAAGAVFSESFAVTATVTEATAKLALFLCRTCSSLGFSFSEGLEVERVVLGCGEYREESNVENVGCSFFSEGQPRTNSENVNRWVPAEGNGRFNAGIDELEKGQ